MNVNQSNCSSIQDGARIIAGDFVDPESVLMVNGQRVYPTGTTPPVFNSGDDTPLQFVTANDSANVARGPGVDNTAAFSGRQRHGGSTRDQPTTTNSNSPGGTPIYNSAGKVIRIKHG
ncbi:hypothetical protein CC1G_09200 [Coprinopsis cinerea okayama7|uniref:Uncharacterized protein n=1 Tax=Coprinopsis cinerea (strain Okayama-7 / 130 / ATCC MYA-4618 / FGSC 9003) TaxID=240176 RepID=A8P4V8_COPC7|nr:hypothetical protein CC1G_09200 [Coprinopsis cinerea okayama7\|eukprot:XP_001838823.2 hypothetical protein CC1G_09200 [Coprinopsis cinerea okayama7\